VHALAKEVIAACSTLLLADDTFAAAAHPAAQGWIRKEAIKSVHEERRADEGVTGTKADAPGTTEPGDKAPTIVVECVIPSERSESRDLHLVFLTDRTESTEDGLGAVISRPDHQKHLGRGWRGTLRRCEHLDPESSSLSLRSL
jgi:hypothetical protein